MAKNQRHYTPEFKQQIVDLYNAGGTSYPQLEREYQQKKMLAYMDELKTKADIKVTLPAEAAKPAAEAAPAAAAPAPAATEEKK